jgi:hypothetical protein
MNAALAIFGGALLVSSVGGAVVDLVRGKRDPLVSNGAQRWLAQAHLRYFNDVHDPSL